MPEMISIGVANEGQVNVNVETLKTWNIKNITFFSKYVYFKHENVFYSMNRTDFDNVFKK